MKPSDWKNTSKSRDKLEKRDQDVLRSFDLRAGQNAPRLADEATGLPVVVVGREDLRRDSPRRSRQAQRLAPVLRSGCEGGALRQRQQQDERVAPHK